jgi:hypothetical protein
MHNLYIDPFLLACPQSDAGIEEFENYILSLTSWGEEIEKIKDANFANIYISAKTSEILAIENGYPEWDKLERTIVNLELQKIIQPRDIFVLIEGLMKLPCIEDNLKLNEILLNNVECNPSCHIDTRTSLFVEHYHRLAILICLLCEFESLEDKTQILITRHSEENSTIITVKGEIVDCEFCEAPQVFKLPHTISGCLNSCVNPNSLYLFIDALKVWLTADCEKFYKQAITIYVYRENCQLENPKSKSKLSSWSFGHRFLKTAKNLNFLDDEIKIKILLRACAETILEENLSATHWLRTGKGANNPQKKRKKDKAGAWRRDIDREYHLHYWQTSSGPEFASVVVHNDMSIPE